MDGGAVGCDGKLQARGLTASQTARDQEAAGAPSLRMDMMRAAERRVKERRFIVNLTTHMAATNQPKTCGSGGEGCAPTFAQSSRPENVLMERVNSLHSVLMV